MYYGYRAQLADFLVDNPDSIIGRLHQTVAEDGFSRTWNTQTVAWQEEVECLQRSFRQIVATDKGALTWTVLLEYEIARRGRRIDAVILTNHAIIILEFKSGLESADAASRWQAYEYGLDLRDFHSCSSSHLILPIVVPTGARRTEETNRVWDLDFRVGVSNAIECQPGHLATLILEVSAGSLILPLIDQDAWCSATYRPSLNIIEAAERVFAGHRVREISHATATNLSSTVDAVIGCVNQAQRDHRRVVCFVTGVPGAGKTLAGLSAVHDPSLRDGARPAAVFLSGNGPLVKVVRSALVRDLKRRSPTEHDGARQVSTFIQNVHSFLGYYAFKAPEEPPAEHVVIFDEAQRAWDGKQMNVKKRGNKSEAELMLEIMARCPDWSVIVALVGFGQEIHQGEAGLQEWGRAISNASPPWSVVASPVVLGAAEEESGGLFPPGVTIPNGVEPSADLHLAVSIRSHRARAVSQWVRLVLEGNATDASGLMEKTTEFPIVLTRRLAQAREWTRGCCGEMNHAGNCGLLASSGALRLRADGIEVSSGFRHGYAYDDWFLRSPGDVRSSCSLEVAATEFECQGLELDWAGICWGDDMSFDAAARTWHTRRFKGSRWISVIKPTARQYILNKYRVLLTRARQGFVIWVPYGSVDDTTRQRDRLDATAEFLLSCGIREL